MNDEAIQILDDLLVCKYVLTSSVNSGIVCESKNYTK